MYANETIIVLIQHIVPRMIPMLQDTDDRQHLKMSSAFLPYELANESRRQP